MILGNIFIQLILVWYTKYLYNMLFPSKRKLMQNTNSNLNELRIIPVKTLEEQKKFINLKYPKKDKFKFRWMMVPSFIWEIFLFIVIYKIYSYIFLKFNLIFPLWVGILFVMIFPVIFNLVMKRFGLEKGTDIRIFLR